MGPAGLSPRPASISTSSAAPAVLFTESPNDQPLFQSHHAVQFKMQQQRHHYLPLSSIRMPTLVSTSKSHPAAFFASTSSSTAELDACCSTFASSSHSYGSAPRRFPGGGASRQGQQPTAQQPSSAARGSSSRDCSNCNETLARFARHKKHIVHRKEAAGDEVPQGAVGVEVQRGRRRVYRERHGVEGGCRWEGFDMLEDAQTNKGRLMELVRSYLLPQGYPESVGPQYAPYMGWRAVQYFFGGALSVLSTKALLGALGVAGRHSGEPQPTALHPFPAFVQTY